MGPCFKLLWFVATATTCDMAAGPWPLVKPLLARGVSSPELYLSHASQYRLGSFSRSGDLLLVQASSAHCRLAVDELHGAG